MKTERSFYQDLHDINITQFWKYFHLDSDFFLVIVHNFLTSLTCKKLFLGVSVDTIVLFKIMADT